MKRFCLSSFRIQILLIGLIAIFPVLGLLMYTAAEQRQTATAQAQEAALRLLRDISGDQEKLIDATHQLLRVMALLPEVQSNDAAACSKLFDNLLKQNSSYVVIGLAKPDGNLICSAPQVSYTINISDRAYFQRTMKTHAFAVGDYAVSRTTGKPAIHFSYPVLDRAGQVKSVLIAGIELNFLNQMAAKTPAGRILTVIDRNGTILSRYPDSEKWVGKSMPQVPVIKTVLKQKSEGTVESKDLDGTTQYFAFRPLYSSEEGGDVYIYTGITASILFADANRMMVRILLGIMLIAILALAVAWAVGNIFLIRRVNALLKATKQLTTGDLSVRSNLPHDQGELGQLASAFDNMAATLEQRTIQLHKAEKRYRTLVEQIPAATFMAAQDEFNTIHYISPQIEQILGFSHAEWLADPGLWHKQLHPDDREHVLAGLTQCKTNSKQFCCEYRLISRDGRVVWVHSKARTVPDETGQTEILQGIMLDITNHKQVEKALHESLEKYRTLFHNANDAICLHELTDDNGMPGQFIDVNDVFCRRLGYSKDELLTMSPKDIDAPECWCQIPKIMQEFLAKGHIIFEMTHMSKNGTKIPVEISSHICVLNDKSVVLSISRDITERKQAEEQLKNLSLHDPLTGLYNRAYFQQEMHRFESGCYNPLSIIVCDVDGLKIINDTMGHNIGDKVLVAVAGILRESFREEDVVARIGGDEFAILLPNSNRTTVESASNRIRGAIERYNNNNLALPLNISIGFATRSNVSEKMAVLFKIADDNMYREKLHHRQCTRRSIVKTFIKSLEARDFITQGHADRMQDLVTDIAVFVGVSEQRLTDLRLLAQFHDIGKVGIPDSILFKEGELTYEEYKEMQRHCEIGCRIAQFSPDLEPIADGILKHHEWWNGDGYPLGLREEEIPLECRILTIADTYDAMTNDRPYRKAMNHEKAVAELKKYSGIRFDPHLVLKFVQVIENKNTNSKCGS